MEMSEVWGIGAVIRLNEDTLSWTPFRFEEPVIADHAETSTRNAYQHFCQERKTAITEHGYCDFLLSAFLGALRRNDDVAEISFWLMLMASRFDMRYWIIAVSDNDHDCILQCVKATSPDDAIAIIKEVVAEMEVMPMKILRERFAETIRLSRSQMN
jgi:hypothetical protein